MRPSFSAPWWAPLAGAIVCEVGGTAALRLSEGLTRPGPTLGVFVLYTGAIVLFSRVLERGIGLGLAYGAFTACGLLAAAVLSVAVFGEPLSWVQIAGVLMLLVGVVTLQVPTRAAPVAEAQR